MRRKDPAESTADLPIVRRVPQELVSVRIRMVCRLFSKGPTPDGVMLNQS
jgi:hypothetical protein